MSRFHAEPHRVVNVTGSDVTVVTSGKRFLTRNKSFFKKLPRVTEHLEEDDDEEDEDTRSKTNPTEDNEGVEFKDSATLS